MENHYYDSLMDDLQQNRASREKVMKWYDEFLDPMPCGQDYRLINVDFFPGPKPDLTLREFAETAKSVLKEVDAREPGLPPDTGRRKTTISEFLLGDRS